MPATPSGADTLANTLLTSLIAGKSFDLPTIDLGDDLFDQPATGAITPVAPLSIDSLTTGLVNGDGAFDRIMTSLVNHLKVEYNSNRIMGAEYTKAYIGVVTAALGTAAQFLLGKDQAYWQAVLAQKQAHIAEIETVKARIELESARNQLVRIRYEALTTEVNYALVKMKLSTEDATYANLIKQGDVLVAQKTGVDHDNTGKAYTNLNILPMQLKLLNEQVQVQRAQTSDHRNDDGAVIVGIAGKQKDLYTQQIKSYQDDAATKVAKMYVDSWITQKTIDEGTDPPSQFTATNINSVITSLKGKVSL